MPDRIENGIAYLNGLKVGDIYGSNYIEISNAGVLSFKGTAHISDDSSTVDVFKAITVQYDASNKMELTVSSVGAGKILMTGSSDSFEIETGDGKIILDAGGDIDIDPAGNDINLLGAGAGKITLATTSMTVYGGDTTGDILVLQGNSADATEKITITGATGITLGGQVTVSNNMILAGRVSTTSLAGAAIAIDATTWQYGEGCELKYNVADWADTYTLTEASAILARMETNEASTNSVYGIQMWGVTNNVNVGNLWGGFAYAYVKGTAAKTITNIYAFQPEISFDAGSAANTITDAAVVRAKVTGGVMSDYTVLDGFRLTLGDMDGGSRTYGNGILLEDDSTMSGTSALTVGLNISIACTNDIKLQSGSTITDASHLSLKTLDDTKRIQLNDRNYAATSGDIIGFSSKPAANATGTQTVYGGQISPRANDNVDVACLVGLMVEPIMKGATVLAVSGDLRGLDVRLTSEGANTVGGIAGNIFCYNLLKSATFTGGVYPIVVKAAGDTQAWTALMEIPTALSGGSNGGGADVYIPITINGTPARITAKYVS